MKSVRIYEIVNRLITRSVRVSLDNIKSLAPKIYINTIVCRDILVTEKATFEELIAFAEDEVRVYKHPIGDEPPHVEPPHEWWELKKQMVEHSNETGLICLVG